MIESAPVLEKNEAPRPTEERTYTTSGYVARENPEEQKQRIEELRALVQDALKEGEPLVAKHEELTRETHPTLGEQVHNFWSDIKKTLRI